MGNMSAAVCRRLVRLRVSAMAMANPEFVICALFLWLTCVPRWPPSASPTETNIATLETPAQRTRCTACGDRTALLPRTLRGWPCTVTCHYVGSFQCAPCLTACEIGDETPIHSHSQSQSQ